MMDALFMGFTLMEQNGLLQKKYSFKKNIILSIYQNRFLTSYFMKHHTFGFCQYQLTILQKKMRSL